jgi:hypothetical protein
MRRYVARLTAATPLLRTTIGYGALELASRVAQATAIFLLAYEFRKDEFGTFYGYLAIYQLVTVLGTGGLLESLMGRIGATDRVALRSIAVAHSRYYVWRSLWIIGGAIPVYVVASLIYRDISLVTYFFAVVGGLTYGMVILVATYLTYSGWNRQSMYLRSAHLLASYALAAGAALYFRQILDFFAGICAAGIVAILALYILHARAPAVPVADLAILKKQSGGYGWFLVPALLNWFFWYGLVLFVSSVFGTVHAAEFAFANNIASVLLMVNTAVSQAWVSRYLTAFASSPALTEMQTSRVFRIQAVLMTVAAVGLVVAYEILIAWHFPLVMKYSRLGYQISILLFSISISSVYFSVINSFAVNGRGAQLAMISLVAYGFSVAILIGLSFGVGVIGVYFGLALLIVSRGFTLTWYARRFLGAGFMDRRLILLNAGLFVVCAWYFLHLGRQ